MFVMVLPLCVRSGEEDAMIALHEDWQRDRQAKVKGFLSGELLRTAKGSKGFLSIIRFENRECAQACKDDPEYQAWYGRVAGLCEDMPELAEYSIEWNSTHALHRK